MARSNKKHTKRKQQKKSVVLTQSSRPAKPLFRLIPITMTMASALLCLKTIEIYQGGRSLHQELFISSVLAQEKSEQPTTVPAENAEGEVEDTEATETAETEDDETTPESGEVAEPVAPPPQDIIETRGTQYNAREIDVLESLSNRREKLDKWESEIALREKVLAATEQRIEGKLTELNALSAELKELLVTYDKEEDAKISSLVKIYETMKPKDAARIFDQLDMDTLLMVVDRMSERRVAPVLAAMSPQKAKEVTQQLADQKKEAPAATDLMDYNPPL
ncbi:MAG: hypothetical protein MK052_00995 [Alphaproteobacteria bacterium]|nr:hypothetical protein [Alphaproteobacteria bacterium]